MLTAGGNDPDYVEQTEARVRAIIEACEAAFIGDVSAFAVQKAVDHLRAKGLSLATCNSYLRSIKGFTSWLCGDKRLRDDPLVGVKQFNQTTDRRRLRCELKPDELHKLLETTELRTLKEHRFCGPDRAMLYRVAVGTGFRVGELRSLRLESFDLDSDPATITVEATHSKRRRTYVQPIHSDLADRLRAWLADKPDGEPVAICRLRQHGC